MFSAELQQSSFRLVELYCFALEEGKRPVTCVSKQQSNSIRLLCLLTRSITKADYLSDSFHKCDRSSVNGFARQVTGRRSLRLHFVKKLEKCT